MGEELCLLEVAHSEQTYAFDLLPLEVLVEILALLEPLQLARCRSVSYLAHILIDDSLEFFLGESLI